MTTILRRTNAYCMMNVTMTMCTMMMCRAMAHFGARRNI